MNRKKALAFLIAATVMMSNIPSFASFAEGLENISVEQSGESNDLDTEEVEKTGEQEDVIEEIRKSDEDNNNLDWDFPTVDVLINLVNELENNLSRATITEFILTMNKVSDSQEKEDVLEKFEYYKHYLVHSDYLMNQFLKNKSNEKLEEFIEYFRSIPYEGDLKKEYENQVERLRDMLDEETAEPNDSEDEDNSNIPENPGEGEDSDNKDDDSEDNEINPIIIENVVEFNQETGMYELNLVSLKQELDGFRKSLTLGTTSRYNLEDFLKHRALYNPDTLADITEIDKLSMNYSNPSENYLVVGFFNEKNELLGYTVYTEKEESEDSSSPSLENLREILESLREDFSNENFERFRDLYFEIYHTNYNTPIYDEYREYTDIRLELSNLSSRFHRIPTDENVRIYENFVNDLVDNGFEGGIIDLHVRSIENRKNNYQRQIERGYSHEEILTRFSLTFVQTDFELINTAEKDYYDFLVSMMEYFPNETLYERNLNAFYKVHETILSIEMKLDNTYSDTLKQEILELIKLLPANGTLKAYYLEKYNEFDDKSSEDEDSVKPEEPTNPDDTETPNNPGDNNGDETPENPDDKEEPVTPELPSDSNDDSDNNSGDKDDESKDEEVNEPSKPEVPSTPPSSGGSSNSGGGGGSSIPSNQTMNRADRVNTVQRIEKLVENIELPQEAQEKVKELQTKLESASNRVEFVKIFAEIQNVIVLNSESNTKGSEFASSFYTKLMNLLK